MVEPLKPFQVDDGGNIRCGRGILRAGKHKGERCRGIISAKDLTIACHNCGEKYSLSELLEEVERLGYLGQVKTRRGLNQKGNRRKEMVERKIEGLKKIIKKAVGDATKDKRTYIELIMPSVDSYRNPRSYHFSSDEFIKIQNDTVVFRGLGGGTLNVPLENVECVEVLEGPRGVSMHKESSHGSRVGW